MSQKKNSTSCIRFLSCCQKQPSSYAEKSQSIPNEVHPDRTQNSARPSRQNNTRSQDGVQTRIIQRQSNNNARGQPQLPQFERANSQINQSQINNNLNTSHHNQPQPPQQQLQEQKKPLKISNIAIETNFKLEDIECCDFLPQDRQLRYDFKYYCPVCLRYFNHMLLSQCCMNYMCHFCADEQIEREKSVEKFQAKCPYNCEGKFILKDDTPNMQVKRYSDSQYMSFYSNNKGAMMRQTQNNLGKTANKENQAPQNQMHANTAENFKPQNRAIFQNSAIEFPRPQYENELDLQENEESKRQAMMLRSDALGQFQQRPPLGQLRAQIVRQANQGFNQQSQIQNGGDEIFSQGPNIFDGANFRFMSPQVRPNFPQNEDQISAIEYDVNGVNTIGSSNGFRNIHQNLENFDQSIYAQGYDLQRHQQQLINIQNFSPQQQISQERDDLNSDEDDLDRDQAL